MTKDEALKLALETLEADPLEMVADANGHMVFLKDKAITAIKEALAQPEQIMQDSTCSTTLHLQGKPYPRTCKKCGLGPCIAQPSTQPEQKPLAWISTGPARMFHWTADKPAYGDDWVPLYTTPPQRTERPVDCERCNRLEEQAYDLVGKLRVANIKLSMLLPRTWAGLMRGVRVEGDTVVIKVKNGNDAARKLCGALIEEMNK